MKYEGIILLSLVVFGLYLFEKGSNGLVNAVSEFDNNLAGAFVPDANVAVQTQFQQFLAAWKAAGKPATGSAPELALRKQFSIPPPPSMPAADVIGSGGSNS